VPAGATSGPITITTPDNIRFDATLASGKVGHANPSIFEILLTPGTRRIPKDEPKTRLRNEPNSSLCFQQKLETKAKFHQ
jgi:hypothetical protein